MASNPSVEEGDDGALWESFYSAPLPKNRGVHGVVRSSGTSRRRALKNSRGNARLVDHPTESVEETTARERRAISSQLGQLLDGGRKQVSFPSRRMLKSMLEAALRRAEKLSLLDRIFLPLTPPGRGAMRSIVPPLPQPSRRTPTGTIVPFNVEISPNGNKFRVDWGIISGGASVTIEDLHMNEPEQPQPLAEWVPGDKLLLLVATQFAILMNGRVRMEGIIPSRIELAASVGDNWPAIAIVTKVTTAGLNIVRAIPAQVSDHGALRLLWDDSQDLASTVNAITREPSLPDHGADEWVPVAAGGLLADIAQLSSTGNKPLSGHGDRNHEGHGKSRLRLDDGNRRNPHQLLISQPPSAELSGIAAASRGGSLIQAIADGVPVSHSTVTDLHAMN